MNLPAALAALLLCLCASEGSIHTDISEGKAIFRVRTPTKTIEQLRILTDFLAAAPQKPVRDHVVVDGGSRGATRVHIERFPNEAPLQVQRNRVTVTNEGIRRKRGVHDDSSANSLASEGFIEESSSSKAAAPGIAPPEVANHRAAVPRRQVSLNPTRTDDIVPYDAHIDPDFPVEAPYAHGLYNIPEGHNLDKDIDVDFHTGYRHGPSPSAATRQQSEPQQSSSGTYYVLRNSFPYGGSPMYAPSVGYPYSSYPSYSYTYYMG